MAIDYIIGLDCPPKRDLTAAGILERLKERQRADEVIEWFRASADERTPDQMGFEFSQRKSGDTGEKQLIVVQDLLDHAVVLDDYAGHCQNCPANFAGRPFGCMGFINYPVTALAETWLLERLPMPDEPLVWLLLRQGIQKLGYDGSSVKALRDAENESIDGLRAYFELPAAPQRRLGEIRVSGDQILESIFGVGNRIIPNHAGILLLFVNAIERDLEAEEIQDISSYDATIRQAISFDMLEATGHDTCIREFIAFFHALYTAWKLNLPLYVDA